MSPSTPWWQDTTTVLAAPFSIILRSLDIKQPLILVLIASRIFRYIYGHTNCGITLIKRRCSKGIPRQRQLGFLLNVLESQHVAYESTAKLRKCLVSELNKGQAQSTVWVKKNPPCGFLKFFLKRLGIFNKFFTHLLHHQFYTRVQIFI